ncbi:hypothetical protein [Amaricoccus sp.]|uniref:hypothetical protein n=1 Tax=Amaricoccus sp. TaxID=1872485 RepID=UPI001B60FBEA|nr:hypothetical protein [Amaricoccus sp.]MBP7001786.1 hypothetical protein [Amaricoccus sp.]
MHLDQYDRIRARIAAEGLTPAIETQIALFVCATKAINLPFLALAGAAVPPAAAWPAMFGGGGDANGPAGVVWQYLNSQLFRESEAVTLLCRITRWSPDPLVYMRSAQLVAPLSAEAARSGFSRAGVSGRAGGGETLGIEALAFGYALLATVRLAPALPAEDAAAPFAVALARIEQENGRLLQTQIRLLKDGYAQIPQEEREAIIAAKIELVSGVFDRFLDALAG